MIDHEWIEIPDKYVAELTFRCLLYDLKILRPKK